VRLVSNGLSELFNECESFVKLRRGFDARKNAIDRFGRPRGIDTGLRIVVRVVSWIVMCALGTRDQ
jgi:hypothetical protein